MQMGPAMRISVINTPGALIRQITFTISANKAKKPITIPVQTSFEPIASPAFRGIVR